MRAARSSNSIPRRASSQTVRAAATRAEAGALASVMTCASVETAVLVKRCSKVVACSTSARFSVRYAAAKAGCFIQRQAVTGLMPVCWAAASIVGMFIKAIMN